MKRVAHLKIWGRSAVVGLIVLVGLVLVWVDASPNPATATGTAALEHGIRAWVAPYPTGRAAVSHTLHGGLATHAEPTRALAARGMTGTLFISPGVIGDAAQHYLTLTQVQEFAAAGHEIAAQGWQPTDQTALPSGTFQSGLDESAQWISVVTATPARSFAYPADRRNPVTDLAVRDRLPYRFHEADTIDWPRDDRTGFDRTLRRAIARGDWLTIRLHDGQADTPLPRIVALNDHLDQLAANPDVWVAPFARVAAYRALWEQTELELIKSGHQSVTFLVTAPADAIASHDAELTLIIDPGADWTDAVWRHGREAAQQIANRDGGLIRLGVRPSDPRFPDDISVVWR